MRATACALAFVLSSGYFFSRRHQKSDLLRTLAGRYSVWLFRVEGHT
jgi:hypothetical protein